MTDIDDPTDDELLGELVIIATEREQSDLAEARRRRLAARQAEIEREQQEQAERQRIAVEQAEERARLAQQAQEHQLFREWAEVAKYQCELIGCARPEVRLLLLDRLAGILYCDDVAKLLVAGYIAPPSMRGLAPLPGEVARFTNGGH